MQSENIAYVRFSDDIKVFCPDYDTAIAMFSRISEIIKGYGLKLSENKCGVFKAMAQTYFGYEFTDTRNGFIIQRKSRNKATSIRHWKEAKIEWHDNEYHIASDGILTKKDFSILFENPEKKMYIPAEAASVISVYSDIILSSDFLKFVAGHRITLRFYDKNGEYIGSFFPVLTAFKGKLLQKINIEGQKFSYAQLINREVWSLRGHILQGDKYTPFICEW